MYFHPDGSCLYSGIKDFLKVYGWEPTQCFDSVPITWGDVADMSIAKNQLVGATSLPLWSLNLLHLLVQLYLLSKQVG